MLGGDPFFKFLCFIVPILADVLFGGLAYDVDHFVNKVGAVALLKDRNRINLNRPF